MNEEENESFLSFMDGAIATELEDINQYQGDEATRTVTNGWDIIIIRYPILKTKWSQEGYNNPNSYGKYCPKRLQDALLQPQHKSFPIIKQWDM